MGIDIFIIIGVNIGDRVPVPCSVDADILLTWYALFMTFPNSYMDYLLPVVLAWTTK